jgi:hypothetical protein
MVGDFMGAPARPEIVDQTQGEKKGQRIALPLYRIDSGL